MSETSELDLLVEIAKLLRRFGPKTFESLAIELSRGELPAALASILASAAKVAPRSENRSKSPRTPSDLRPALVALGESEPEKASLLLDVYDRLTDQSLLPTLRDIRMFAADAGLSVPKKGNRVETITSLIKNLQRLPAAELEAKCSALKSSGERSDRSLEGWSRIILDKTGRTKRGSE